VQQDKNNCSLDVYFYPPKELDNILVKMFENANERYLELNNNDDSITLPPNKIYDG
jgi:hypothetical protein